MLKKPVPESMEEAVSRAAEAIAASRYLVAFTGAGVSVESGIPPFRGPGGLWERYDPAILDIDHFHRECEASWKAIKALFYDHWGACEPNDAHRILADWEKRGLLRFTITQNIDGLHSRAGCRNVSEYHGTLAELFCERCGARVAATAAALAAIPPRCPECGRALKPAFVFFGEGIPENAARAAEQATLECDCMLIVGTSGEVYPAAALPPLAKRRGATIIEINPSPSAYTDRIGDIRIQAGAVAGMRALEARLSGIRRPDEL